MVDGTGVVASASLSDLVWLLSFPGVSASLNDREKIAQSYFTYPLESRLVTVSD